MPSEVPLQESVPEDNRVVLFTGSPYDGTEIDVDITNLALGAQWSHVAPGGDADLTFHVSFGRALTEGDLIQMGTKIMVIDNGGGHWLGRLEDFEMDVWPNGAIIQYVARGMSSAADDQIYRSQKKWAEGIAIASIFEETTADLCPDIIYVPSDDLEGRVLPENSQDFLFSSAKKIWDTIAPIGGNGVPVVWEVNSGGGTIAALVVRARASGARYYVRQDSGVYSGIPMRGGAKVHMSGSLLSVRNRISVKYLADTPERYAIHQAAASPIFTNGVIRDLGIDLNSLELRNRDGVVDVPGMILGQLANPANTGRSITIPYPCSVYDSILGQMIPIWRIQAGYVIQVVDMPTGDANYSNEFYIQRRDWVNKPPAASLSCGPVRVGGTDLTSILLKSKTQGRADPIKAGIVSNIAREVTLATAYDRPAFGGSTNTEQALAPGDHDHGTPNGDIGATISIFASAEDDDPAVYIPVGYNCWVNLIHGRLRSWTIQCKPVGASISFHVVFPASGDDPGGEITCSGSNGATGDIGDEDGMQINSDTVAEATVTANGDLPADPPSNAAQSAALLLSGSRNKVVDLEAVAPFDLDV